MIPNAITLALWLLAVILAFSDLATTTTTVTACIVVGFSILWEVILWGSDDRPTLR